MLADSVCNQKQECNEVIEDLLFYFDTFPKIILFPITAFIRRVNGSR